MKHVPHLVVGAPWDGNELELSLLQWRHLTKVLRMRRGDPVSYTDGLGRVGRGRLTSHALERGDESELPRPSHLTVAVAPPANKDRQRYVVEKLAELGVSRLRWLATSHGTERTASPAKVFSWALAATEQSRGAWLMETPKDVVSLADLSPPLVVCHAGGAARPPAAVETVAIGPEGGFGDDELPDEIATWDLGPTVLRVETAAVVAAARILSR